MEGLQRWQLGGEGGWDYLLADQAKERVFISPGTRVDVMSSESGRLIGFFPDRGITRGAGSRETLRIVRRA